MPIKSSGKELKYKEFTAKASYLARASDHLECL